MSESALLEAAEPATDDRIAALVARAKDILAGRLVPPPLEAPWMVEYLQREYGHKVPPPTAEAVRYQVDHAALDALYDGECVLVYDMPQGYKTVVAEGEDDIKAVLAAVTDKEHSRLVITSTGLWFRI